jgi:serine/threonine protein kinase
MNDTPTNFDRRTAGPITIPGYELLDELGRGGMGVVFRAKRLDTQQPVAIKVIRDSALVDEQGRARFRIEAEAAARMNHPNVVGIHEVGEHDGRPYLVMEHVDGGGLDRHLNGEPFPPRSAAELVRTLALAVAHAHARHIVHRDLKPANVLLVAGESTLVPKIADFGLAKRLDTDSTAWTRDGAVIGTPSYMAPEQAGGRVQEVGTRTDVYALGATFYELLTGHPPFDAPTPTLTIHQVLHDDPAPPTRVNPAVPLDLETVCLKCLEKDPARRYLTADELADDLGRFLDGQPIAAVPVGAAERLARSAERDGYKIGGEIGRGPRAVVHHARSAPLNQPVAVKVFPAGLCTKDEWDARLRRGAELWSALAHPHIVPVHRAGWWDGRPGLVLEHVPHGSLAGQLDGRPHPLAAALKLVERLADLVGYIHRQGMVHGNLKPSNVLMAADGIPRLTDFRLTGGLYFGPTPADADDPAGVGYLAPEYLRDPDADPRPHTDVYGLGLILYELLAGRPAFGGATAGEVLANVRTGNPPPPSQVNPAVPPAVDRFCLRCLRTDPWQRYPRAYDLVTRLRRLQDAPSAR